MLRLEMLPAGCGDCLWIEYGDAGPGRVVIVDGGLRPTAQGLRRRIEAARQQRGVATLEVELLVVTHIDNDHIVGITELLREAGPELHVKDLWFNGKPQLERLPPEPPAAPRGPADLMGGAPAAPARTAFAPADLLGRQQADDLSALLAKKGLPSNALPPWGGAPVMVPATGTLPAVTLEGGLVLTVLGPMLPRLRKLCEAWGDVLSGKDEAQAAGAPAAPADLLGRKDTWPPVWKDGETTDGSAANGSSIALLAEFGGHALLLAADAYAGDLAEGLARVAASRGLAKGAPLPIDVFKLPHHASQNNLTKALMEAVDCTRFAVSTDGSVHRHPDHQALLRVLKYARRTPELVFNHDVATTRPWREKKADVTKHFRDYRTSYPKDPAAGAVMVFD